MKANNFIWLPMLVSVTSGKGRYSIDLSYLCNSPAFSQRQAIPAEAGPPIHPRFYLEVHQIEE